MVETKSAGGFIATQTLKRTASILRGENVENLFRKYLDPVEIATYGAGAVVGGLLATQANKILEAHVKNEFAKGALRTILGAGVGIASVEVLKEADEPLEKAFGVGGLTFGGIMLFGGLTDIYAWAAEKAKEKEQKNQQNTQQANNAQQGGQQNQQNNG